MPDMNYYWTDGRFCSNGDDYHLGKKTGVEFIWAKDPEAIREACKENAHAVAIQNQNFKRMSCGAFLRVVDECKAEDLTAIGQRFS